MKKFMTAALALVLTLGMSVTTFAASSVTANGVTAKDSKGNTVAVTVTELTAAEKKEANEVAQEKYGVAPLWAKDIEVVGASKSNPVTIQIPMPAVNSGDTIMILHKRDADGVWEALSGVATSGYVSVTTTSCSPFAVVRTATSDELPYSPDYYEELKAMYGGDTTTVAAETTTDAAATTSVASPKTADNGVLGFVVIAALCGATFVLVPRKKFA